jgi:D-hexose-6-phosphate mutarotase
MSTIEIASGELVAYVNTQGAHLETVMDLSGDQPQHLLFPSQYLDEGSGEKFRGGMPFCVVFGKAEVLGLNQHGFARDKDVVWDVDSHTERHVTLGLEVDKSLASKKGIERYLGLSILYNLSINDNVSPTGSQLQADFTITNEKGDRPMVITPGIHPYFGLGEDECATDVAIRFGSGPRPPVQLTEKELLKTHVSDDVRVARFAVDGRDVIIRNRRLGVTAVWSNNPDTYICVEPTYVGAAAAKAKKEEELSEFALERGDNTEHSAFIVWLPQERSSNILD